MGKSPSKKLADQFATRNAAEIGEGLRRLVHKQAEIVDTQTEDYENYTSKADATGDPDDAPDPAVADSMRTSLMNNIDRLFRNGTKLYQLDKPASSVQVNVGVGVGAQHAQVTRSDAPRVLVSKAIGELEEAGIEPTDYAIEQRIKEYEAIDVEAEEE